MSQTKYKLFLISQCLNGITKRPIETYISANYDTAKLYFQHWLEDKEIKTTFMLYQIGEIDKELKIEAKKIYITGGYQVNYENKMTKQKLDEEREMIRKASKHNQRENKKIIIDLFNGREIK